MYSGLLFCRKKSVPVPDDLIATPLPLGCLSLEQTAVSPIQPGLCQCLAEPGTIRRCRLGSWAWSAPGHSAAEMSLILKGPHS